MWYEADLDALMTRTCLRPIPTGKINKKHALIFGIFLSIVSVIGLYYFSNFLSATFIIYNNCFLSFCLHNLVKRKTPQNIVIGGAAGALPPVIGWTIATNSLTLNQLHFFNYIFLDTISFLGVKSL